MYFFVENFKIVLFCNNFSCRSKVLGSLSPKSDLLRIYSVWQGSNLFKEITSIEEGPGSWEAEKDEIRIHFVNNNISDFLFLYTLSVKTSSVKSDEILGK